MIRSRPTLALLSAILSGAALLAGCGRHANSVTLAGSTAFQPFAEKLADAYMAAHPDVTVTVQGGGSAVGIQSALLGTAAIGMADLVQLPPEAAKLTATVAARDAIAVIVHPRNTVTNLTTEQLRDVFRGKIRNWREVGGLDHAIALVSRESGSGTRSSFESILAGVALPTDAIIQDSNGTIRETVANDPNAIGYLSHGLVNAQIKSLTIDGAPCTTEAVLAARYPFVRPIFLLTQGPPAGLPGEFIAYVLSDAGQGLLQKDGLIPAR